MTRHIPRLIELLKPFGLVRAEVDEGVAGEGPGTPAPFVAMALITFNSLEEFQKGWTAHGQELAGDVPSYTDIEPQVQISRIIS